MGFPYLLSPSSSSISTAAKFAIISTFFAALNTPFNTHLKPMASSHTFSLSFFLFSLFSLSSSDQQPTSSLVLPVSKDSSSFQYITRISQRTPLVPINVVLDLSGPFLWLYCGPSYISSTYHSIQCHSPLCSLAHALEGCNKTCIVFSQNVFTSKVSKMELSEDVLSLHSTNGLYPTSMASSPQFPFLCEPEFPSEGLTAGVAGLGHGRLGLPELLAGAFNLSKKFAICLSSSRNEVGVLFFGDGPYVLLPGIDVSKLLISTPLFMRPKGMEISTHFTNPPNSYDYYIRLKSIRVNGKKVPLNSPLLAKISTFSAYTIMETSIYASLTKHFIEEALAANVSRVSPKEPFRVCFTTNGALQRPAMPVIDLVLQSEEVFWRIFETNSMVEVGNGVSCLGFLDGGANLQTPITIGGYQMEDNLLQFDLVSSKLGFTNTLLFRETNCASFNFSA